jgi:hypothetical protein
MGRRPMQRPLFDMLDEVRSCTSCQCILALAPERATFDEVARYLRETVHNHRIHHSKTFRIDPPPIKH